MALKSISTNGYNTNSKNGTHKQNKDKNKKNKNHTSTEPIPNNAKGTKKFGLEYLNFIGQVNKLSTQK